MLKFWKKKPAETPPAPPAGAPAADMPLDAATPVPAAIEAVAEVAAPAVVETPEAAPGKRGWRERLHKREFADAMALREALREALVALLRPVQQPLEPVGRKPFVVLTVGINGVGKTTTIGKLARRWRDEGRNVLLAAGDTF